MRKLQAFRAVASPAGRARATRQLAPPAGAAAQRGVPDPSSAALPFCCPQLLFSTFSFQTHWTRVQKSGRGCMPRRGKRASMSETVRVSHHRRDF